MVQQAGLLALQGGVVLDDTGAPLLELVSENANNLYINFFNKIRQHFLGMKLIADWGGKIYISQWECSIGKSIYLSYVRERNSVLFAREHWFAAG